MRQVALREGSVNGIKVGRRRVGKPKLDWIQEGKSAWKTFRNELDHSERRHPNRRRKFKAKLEQDMQILEWAIEKIFQDQPERRKTKQKRKGRARATLPKTSKREAGQTTLVGKTNEHG